MSRNKKTRRHTHAAVTYPDKLMWTKLAILSKMHAQFGGSKTVAAQNFRHILFFFFFGFGPSFETRISGLGLRSKRRYAGVEP